jgi:hypothetical protein
MGRYHRDSFPTAPSPMPTSWNPGELPTILVALAALAGGIGLHRRIPALQRLHIPAPVVGEVPMQRSLVDPESAKL